MLNKKIANEIGIGIILLFAIITGALFLMQTKNKTANEVKKETQQQSQNKTAIANPASTYCIEHGGKSEIINNADGSQSGNCVFENGSKCEEWAYMRGECLSKDETSEKGKIFCTMDAKKCPDGSYVGRTGPKCEFAPCPAADETADWQTYKNDKYGFELNIPNSWQVEEDSDLGGKVEITFQSPEFKNSSKEFNEKQKNEGTAGEGPVPNYIIQIYKNTEKNLDDLVKTLMINPNKGFKKIDINGNQAYAGLSAGFIPTFVVYMENKGMIYEIVFDYSISSIEDVQYRYPFMVNTFKFAK